MILKVHFMIKLHLLQTWHQILSPSLPMQQVLLLEIFARIA
jgi:hypothetical protein